MIARFLRRQMRRIELWLCNQRAQALREESEFHKSVAVQCAQQASDLERQSTILRIELL